MTRREITVRGQGPEVRASFFIEVYKGKVWVTSFSCPAVCGDPGAGSGGFLSRYEPDSPVHRAVQTSAPSLLEQCREVTDALHARERA